MIKINGQRSSPFFIGKNTMNVQALLEVTLPALGYEFVDLELMRNNSMRIFIDKPEGVGIEDCVAVSNHLTHLFMAENIDFERLEISSPGLDRLVKKEADFVRFAGQKAKVKLRIPLNGQRNFLGILRGVEAQKVLLETELGLVLLPIGHIDRAKLQPEF